MTQLVWLVTGCSSGFGTAFVHEILARGDKVIATSRNAETKLAHLKETGAAILDLDVTLPQAELDAKIQDAIKIYGHIDGLINNAGYLEMGFIEELSQQQWENQLSTNMYGSMNVTKSLLPHFRSRKAGKIAFTSSVFSWISIAGGVPYTVSKHGLAGYAQTLNDEVTGFGITTTLFDIGHFRTPVVGPNANYTSPKIDDYKEMWADFEGLAANIHGNQPGDPKRGVERMIDVLKSEGMAKGKPVPMRIQIGVDAWQIVKAKATDILKVCDEWEALACSTDFPGPKQGF